MTRLSLFLGGCLVALAIACGNDHGTDPAIDAADCNGTALFTVSPIALANVVGWVPLGNLNPPAHTFPTNHQYLYHTNPGSGAPHTVDVAAPAAITITRASRTTYSTDGHSDYSLDFFVCKQVRGGFAHIASLTPSLTTALGAFDQFCDTYSPAPGTTVTTCATTPGSVPLAAGAAIGTAGGTAGVYGIDFSLWDTRVTPTVFANPSRWAHNDISTDDYHVVPASDYFAEPVKSQIAAKLGSGDGLQHRTVPPLGGTIAVDVAGTAQGAWFHPTEPHFPESAHLALVPDNVDPSRIVFSVGTSQPGLAGSVYSYLPAANGLINRAPSSITADGQIRCVDVPVSRTILLQLVDANTLKVEARLGAGTCAAQQPWAFTAQSMTYVR